MAQQLNCRLYNFTYPMHMSQMPWCINTRLDEDELDELRRTRHVFGAIHSTLVLANAANSARQAECGKYDAAVCSRLQQLAPATFKQLYLDPLVFQHSASSSRSPDEMDGTGFGDGSLFGQKSALIKIVPSRNGRFRVYQKYLHRKRSFRKRTLSKSSRCPSGSSSLTLSDSVQSPTLSDASDVFSSQSIARPRIVLDDLPASILTLSGEFSGNRGKYSTTNTVSDQSFDYRSIQNLADTSTATESTSVLKGLSPRDNKEVETKDDDYRTDSLPKELSTDRSHISGYRTISRFQTPSQTSTVLGKLNTGESMKTLSHRENGTPGGRVVSPQFVSIAPTHSKVEQRILAPIMKTNVLPVYTVALPSTQTSIYEFTNKPAKVRDTLQNEHLLQLGKIQDRYFPLLNSTNGLTSSDEMTFKGETSSDPESNDSVRRHSSFVPPIRVTWEKTQNTNDTLSADRLASINLDSVFNSDFDHSAGAGSRSQMSVIALLSIGQMDFKTLHCSSRVNVDQVHILAGLQMTLSRLTGVLGLRFGLKVLDRCGSSRNVLQLLKKHRKPLAILHDLEPNDEPILARIEKENVTTIALKSFETRFSPNSPFRLTAFPPNDSEIRAILKVLKNEEIKNTQIIHSNSFSKQNYSSIFTETHHLDNQCFRSVEFQFFLTTMNMNQATKNLNDVSFVVSLLGHRDLETFLGTIDKTDELSSIFLIGGQSASESVRVLRRYIAKIGGIILLRRVQIDTTDIITALRTEAILDNKSTTGGLMKDLFRQLYRQCGNKCTVDPNSIEKVVLAVNSLVSALWTLKSYHCGAAQHVGICSRLYHESINLSTSFNSVLNNNFSRNRADSVANLGLPTFSFDQHGFAQVSYDIFNLRASPDKTSRYSFKFMKIGSYDERNGVTLDLDPVYISRNRSTALITDRMRSCTTRYPSFSTDHDRKLQDNRTKMDRKTNEDTGKASSVYQAPKQLFKAKPDGNADITQTMVDNTIISTNKVRSDSHALTVINEKVTENKYATSPKTASISENNDSSQETGSLTSLSSPPEHNEYAIRDHVNALHPDSIRHEKLDIPAKTHIVTSLSNNKAKNERKSPELVAKTSVDSAKVHNRSNVVSTSNRSSFNQLNMLNITTDSGFYVILDLDVHEFGNGSLQCGFPLKSSLVILDWVVSLKSRFLPAAASKGPGLLVLDGCQQPLKRQHDLAEIIMAVERDSQHRLLARIGAGSFLSFASSDADTDLVTIGHGAAGNTSLSLSFRADSLAETLFSIIKAAQCRALTVVYSADSDYLRQVNQLFQASLAEQRLQVRQHYVTNNSKHDVLAKIINSLRKARQFDIFTVVLLLTEQMAERMMEELNRSSLDMYLVIYREQDTSDTSQFSHFSGVVRVVPDWPQLPTDHPEPSDLTRPLWPQAQDDMVRSFEWSAVMTSYNALVALTNHISATDATDARLDASNVARLLKQITFYDIRGNRAGFDSDGFITTSSLKVEVLRRSNSAGTSLVWRTIGRIDYNATVGVDFSQLTGYQRHLGEVPVTQVTALCSNCHQQMEPYVSIQAGEPSLLLLIVADVHVAGSGHQHTCGGQLIDSTLASLLVVEAALAAATPDYRLLVLDSCESERLAVQLLTLRLSELLSDELAVPTALIGLSETACAAASNTVAVHANIPRLCLPVTAGVSAEQSATAVPSVGESVQLLPTVRQEMEVVSALVHSFRWTAVHVVHSLDQYGVAAAGHLMTLAAQSAVCVVSVTPVALPVSAKRAASILSQLHQTTTADTPIVVLLLLSSHQSGTLFLQTVHQLNMSDSFIFVGGKHLDYTKLVGSEILSLHRTLFMYLSNVETSHDIPVNPWYLTKRSKLPTRWLNHLEESPCANPANTLKSECSGDKGVSQRIIDSVSTIAHSARPLINKDCSNITRCHSELPKLFRKRVMESVQQKTLTLYHQWTVWSFDNQSQPLPLALYREGHLNVTVPHGQGFQYSAVTAACHSVACIQLCQAQLASTFNSSTALSLLYTQTAFSVFGIVAVVLSVLGAVMAVGCLVHTVMGVSRGLTGRGAQCQLLLGLLLLSTVNVLHLSAAGGSGRGGGGGGDGSSGGAVLCVARLCGLGAAQAAVSAALLVTAAGVWAELSGCLAALTRSSVQATASLALWLIQLAVTVLWLWFTQMLHADATGIRGSGTQSLPTPTCLANHAVRGHFVWLLAYTALLKLLTLAIAATAWRYDDRKFRLLFGAVLVNSAIWTTWIVTIFSDQPSYIDVATVVSTLLTTAVLFATIHMMNMMEFAYIWRRSCPTTHTERQNAVSTVNSSFIMRTPSHFGTISSRLVPSAAYLSARMQENARVWSETPVEQLASLDFYEESSDATDRSDLSSAKIGAIRYSATATAEMTLSDEKTVSETGPDTDSEMEDMHHYAIPGEARQCVTNVDGRLVLVMPTAKHLHKGVSKI